MTRSIGGGSFSKADKEKPKDDDDEEKHEEAIVM